MLRLHQIRHCCKKAALPRRFLMTHPASGARTWARLNFVIAAACVTLWLPVRWHHCNTANCTTRRWDQFWILLCWFNTIDTQPCRLLRKHLISWKCSFSEKCCMCFILCTSARASLSGSLCTLVQCAHLEGEVLSQVRQLADSCCCCRLVSSSTVQFVFKMLDWYYWKYPWY